MCRQLRKATVASEKRQVFQRQGEEWSGDVRRNSGDAIGPRRTDVGDAKQKRAKEIRKVSKPEIQKWKLEPGQQREERAKCETAGKARGRKEKGENAVCTPGRRRGRELTRRCCAVDLCGWAGEGREKRRGGEERRRKVDDDVFRPVFFCFFMPIILACHFFPMQFCSVRPRNMIGHRSGFVGSPPPRPAHSRTHKFAILMRLRRSLGHERYQKCSANQRRPLGL